MISLYFKSSNNPINRLIFSILFDLNEYKHFINSQSYWGISKIKLLSRYIFNTIKMYLHLLSNQALCLNNIYLLIFAEWKVHMLINQLFKIYINNN